MTEGKSTLLKNQGISVLLLALLQLLSIIILNRLLNPEDFGLYALSSVFIVIAKMISEGGLGSALVQRDTLTNSFINSTLTISFFLYGIISLLIIILSNAIGEIYNDERLTIIVRYLTIPFIIDGLVNVPKSLLLRKFEYIKLRYLNSFSFLLGMIIIGSTLAYKGYGIWSIVYGQIITSVISFLIAFNLVEFKFNFTFNKSDYKDLFYFGGGITLSKIFNYFYVQGDKIILSSVYNLSVLGQFDRLYRIVTMITAQIGLIMDSVLFPSMSRIIKDENNARSLYEKCIQIVIVIGSILSLTLPSFSYEIIYVIIGENWVHQSYLLSLLFILPLPRFISRMGDSLMRSYAFVYKSAIIKLFSAIITLLAIFFSSRYGLEYVVYSYIISTILTGFYLHVIIIKRLNINAYKIISFSLNTIFKMTFLASPLYFFCYINYIIADSVLILFFLKLFYMIIISLLILKIKKPMFGTIFREFSEQMLKKIFNLDIK